MLQPVGAFLLVWSCWSYLDEEVLQFHPWPELVLSAVGLLLAFPWRSAWRTAVREPARHACEMLERV